MSSFWSKRIVRPLSGFLTQGLSIQKLALSLALGFMFGIFPVLGTTTILCTLVAIIFKLNLPALQFANYLVYPLQILLLVPFYKLGNLLFDAQLSVDFDTLANILAENSPTEILTILFESTMYAIVAWTLISPLLFTLLYAGLKPLLPRLVTSATRRNKFRREKHIDHDGG